MEGQRCGITAFRADGPYPSVEAACRNHRYAEAMLSNVGSANSEMTAVAFYFYDHLVTANLPEVAEVFQKLSMVEMHHLDIFCTLAQQLGADPRFWCRQGGRATWWTPGYVHYSQRLGPLLQIAIRGEQEAIRKYREQARWIEDRNVVENLERIALDEELHLDILNCLMQSYGCREMRWPAF